jgi:hypothetical protein
MTPEWTASVRRIATMGVVVGLVGCTSAQAPDTRTGTPSPTISSTPESLPVVAVTLTRAPEACAGPVPRPRQVDPSYGNLVGDSPVWAGMYADFEAETRTYRALDAPRTEYGWRIKVLWLIEPDHEGLIDVRGANTSTGEALWFAAEGEDPGTSLALDPSEPGAPSESGGWREFPSYLYFPRAGCYEVGATWSGGAWQLGFGLGR